MGKGTPKGGCFKCGGPHYAANCPCTFAGGKGKGKDWSPPHMQQGQQGSWMGKGAGAKGKGKSAPKGGCFKCGGPHYAADCSHGPTLATLGEHMGHAWNVPAGASWDAPPSSQHEMVSSLAVARGQRRAHQRAEGALSASSLSNAETVSALWPRQMMRTRRSP